MKIYNDARALAAAIAPAGPNPKVVVEATYGCYWAADVLEECGAELHLAHPLGMKGITSHRRVKNDVKDAVLLADLLRPGACLRRTSPLVGCGSCGSWSATGPSS